MRRNGCFLRDLWGFLLMSVLTLCPVMHAACPAMDITADCFVDLEDLSDLLGQWLVAGEPGVNCPSLDMTDDCKIDLQEINSISQEWLTGHVLPDDPAAMVWVAISDPNFSGEISRYETTNGQYCAFLNAALASGDISVVENEVIGAAGSNSGDDFSGEIYYDCDGPGYTDFGATNGGAARIHFADGEFSVDDGFMYHPVTQVSWYGATAFCNYYGYRLPTEWEWQGVADYDGSYTYGCGADINNTIANYNESEHPHGTSIVSDFGTYGYGLSDMAGNVFEWTSTVSGDSRVIRGGSWSSGSALCTVDFKADSGLFFLIYDIGFRACR